MADIEHEVRDLRIRITEANGRALTAVVKFTIGPDNYTITVPRVIQTRLARFLRELMKPIAPDEDIIRDTVVEKDLSTRFQP